MKEMTKCVGQYVVSRRYPLYLSLTSLSYPRPLLSQCHRWNIMDELLSYFEHTYVCGRRLRGRGENYGLPLFSNDIWNQRETNIVEGWHHSLQAIAMHCGNSCHNS